MILAVEKKSSMRYNTSLEVDAVRQRIVSCCVSGPRRLILR